MDEIISIIVPVYNVEKFLPACIDSVLKQTNPQWELILVDDGSLDSSGKICEDYALNDQRIRVFHKNNGGVSSARNYGIKKATGEWITFLDGDDSFEPYSIAFILEHIKNMEILRFGFKEVKTNSKKIVHIHSTDNRNVFFNRVIGYKDSVAVWGGVYSRRLFEENTIFFDESLIKAEDWKILFLLALKANRIKSIDEPLYLYNKTNENSCTSSISYEIEFDSLKVFRFIYDNVDGLNGTAKKILQSTRLKLYHKIICKIAIVERYHIVNAFRQVKKAQRMLQLVTLRDVWSTKRSLRKNIIDILSLYRFTFPLFLFLYNIK